MLAWNIPERNESNGQFNGDEDPEDDLGANIQNLIVAPRCNQVDDNQWQLDEQRGKPETREFAHTLAQISRHS